MAKAKKAKPVPLARDLRQAIVDSGLTHYRIGKTAGVAPQMIDRFVHDDRDLRLRTAGRLALALGYELTKSKGD
ncbi:MAG: hypothetical protein EXS05_14155 [Planctomycetaceae bacterium]|nr:hypothetical protein [Planctomycetaceae bacterium]